MIGKLADLEDTHSEAEQYMICQICFEASNGQTLCNDTRQQSCIRCNGIATAVPVRMHVGAAVNTPS